MRSYVYQPGRKMTFEKAVRHLETRGEHRIVRQAVDNTSPHVVEQILRQAEILSIRPLSIDLTAFEKYVTDAEYDRRYPEYYAGNLPEKSLEHYVAFHLLDLHEGEVFIDLASEHSPLSEIFERLTGARTYSQDIMYPDGIHGRRIGGGCLPHAGAGRVCPQGRVDLLPGTF